jgi:hypothetical protein
MRTTTNRTRQVLVGLGLGVVALGAAAAAIGALTTTQVATVTQTTTASPDAIWNLWADVPNRTRWDSGLVWARIDGPFQQGATGEVRLKDQPTRRFEVIDSGRRAATPTASFSPWAPAWTGTTRSTSSVTTGAR